jgi:hypothetical protein
MTDSEANECPSHFALDDHELHGGQGGGRDAAVARHLERCRRCERRIAERAAQRAAFGETAPVWTRIAARGRERQRRRRLFSFQLPALALGLGAVVLLVVARSGADRAPGALYQGPKGAGPVEISRRRGGVIARVAPDDEVMPGDVLRFRPRPVATDARFIQIGTVDGSGRYTPFYPSSADATSVPLPGPGQALDGGIELDAAPGPERLFVVLSATPLRAAAVGRVAEGHAAAGTTADAIDGAPVTSAWIVLRKRAGGSTAP